jgi:hypothetical protein
MSACDDQNSLVRTTAVRGLGEAILNGALTDFESQLNLAIRMTRVVSWDASEARASSALNTCPSNINSQQLDNTIANGMKRDSSRRIFKPQIKLTPSTKTNASLQDDLSNPLQKQAKSTADSDQPCHQSMIHYERLEVLMLRIIASHVNDTKLAVRHSRCSSRPIRLDEVKGVWGMLHSYF